MPCGVCVIFRASGTNTRSFKDVKMRMVRMRKKENEPAGISKVPRFRSMKVACSIVKVFIWEYTVQKRVQVDHIGTSISTILTSSTCVTVDSVRELTFSSSVDVAFSSRIAALSRHLTRYGSVRVG